MVVFPASSPLVFPSHRQAGGLRDDPLRIGRGLAFRHLLRDGVKVHAVDPGGRAGKVAPEHLVVQAQCFENLCAAVAVQGGDSHFRHDLQDALAQSLDIVVDGRREGHVAQHSLGDHVVKGFIHQIGIHRTAAVPEQDAMVVHFPRLSAFQHDAAPGPLPNADQVMMHGANGE